MEKKRDKRCGKRIGKMEKGIRDDLGKGALFTNQVMRQVRVL